MRGLSSCHLAITKRTAKKTAKKTAMRIASSTHRPPSMILLIALFCGHQALRPQPGWATPGHHQRTVMDAEMDADVDVDRDRDDAEGEWGMARADLADAEWGALGEGEGSLPWGDLGALPGDHPASLPASLYDGHPFDAVVQHDLLDPRTEDLEDLEAWLAGTTNCADPAVQGLAELRPQARRLVPSSDPGAGAERVARARNRTRPRSHKKRKICEEPALLGLPVAWQSHRASLSAGLKQQMAFYLQQSDLGGVLAVFLQLTDAAEVCQGLLSEYPQIAQLRGEHYETLLHRAVEHQRYHFLVVLLMHFPQLVLAQDEEGHTALHRAISSYQPWATELLAGPLILLRSRMGCTALHAAVQAGDVMTVRFLLDHFASQLVTKQASGGKTALLLALAAGHWECARLLAPHEIQLSDHLGIHALHIAIEAGNLQMVEFLLRLSPCGKRAMTGRVTPEQFALLQGAPAIQACFDVDPRPQAR